MISKKRRGLLWRDAMKRVRIGQQEKSSITLSREVAAWGTNTERSGDLTLTHNLEVQSQIAGLGTRDDCILQSHQLFHDFHAFVRPHPVWWAWLVRLLSVFWWPDQLSWVCGTSVVCFFLPRQRRLMKEENEQENLAWAVIQHNGDSDVINGEFDSLIHCWPFVYRLQNAWRFSQKALSVIIFPGKSYTVQPDFVRLPVIVPSNGDAEDSL